MKQIDTKFGKFNVFNNDAISKDLERGVFWESWTRKYFDALLPGEGFVDVGANFGFYTVYMALRHCPTFAFEPAKGLFSVLESNIKLNQLNGAATAHQVALWDGSVDKVVISQDWLTDPASNLVFSADGDVDYDAMVNSGGMSVVPGGVPFPEDRKKNVYEARTLDSYRGFFGREEGDASPTRQRIGLIKIDAQGADLKVLQGARLLIEVDRPLLLFEYEPGPSAAIGDTLQMYYDFVEEIGYESEVLYWVGTQKVGYPLQFGARPLP